MKNILGLGTAGCNIVEVLSQHSEYTPYMISSNINSNKKHAYKLKKLDNPEEYECLQTKAIDRFLLKIKNQLTVFVCGASISSGLILKILEPLHKRGVEIEVVYIVPEVEVLSEMKTMQERLTRGILQEYARSAVFEKITLVSNTALEHLSPGATVMNYYEQINQLLATTYYMIDVYKNSEPVSSTISQVGKHCRISTLALVDMSSSIDKPLYEIEDFSEIVYYFGLNKEKLETEKDLFRVITNRVKEKINKTTKASFAIYSTKYEEDYAYAEYYSSKIQKNT